MRLRERGRERRRSRRAGGVPLKFRDGDQTVTVLEQGIDESAESGDLRVLAAGAQVHQDDSAVESRPTRPEGGKTQQMCNASFFLLQK